MLESIKKDLPTQISIIFFLFITIWWAYLFLNNIVETDMNYYFGATYGLICLWGGFWGIVAAKKWGGFTSTIGTALMFLSFGLFAQEFGQLVFSYYNIFLKVEVPYPSLADIGFFGTIPLYIYGIVMLAKASGAKFSLQSLPNKMQALFIPVLLLTVTYFVFLKDHEFDFSNPLQVFLDFGYPIGEAIYISIAVLTYSLSIKLLGGIMQNKILLIVFAFVMQYIAEFNFLFQSSQGTWINGGYGDYLYFLAYFIMSLGLIQMKVVADKIKQQ